jgi:8-oxo-dGTP diphosphatase
MTEYELPNISVDVVPVILNSATGTLEVVLGKRIFAPNLGEFALPGVLLTPHERLDEAAYRALEKKLGVQKADVVELIDLGTFDNPDRDPRGATVAIAKLAVITQVPAADNVTSVPIEKAANDSYALPFDHNSIVLAASNLIAEKMLFNKAITKAILGDTFTTKTLRNVLVQLQDTENGENVIFDASNLTRQLKGTKWVEMVADKETITSLSVTTSRGRPSRVWTWL